MRQRAPEFLTMGQIIEMHHEAVAEHGGMTGILSMDLLQSAVAVPYMTFGYEFVHQDIYEMAAAYAFHIIRDHPFRDGDKRTGLRAALTFLDINNTRVRLTDEEVVWLGFHIQDHEMTIAQIASFFRARERRR